MDDTQREMERLADSLEAIAVFSNVDAASYCEMNKAASVLRSVAAANQASALPLPEGWQAVPVKATPEIEAAIKEVAPKWYAPSVWGSLLAAAPLLVQPEGGE